MKLKTVAAYELHSKVIITQHGNKRQVFYLTKMPAGVYITFISPHLDFSYSEIKNICLINVNIVTKIPRMITLMQQYRKQDLQIVIA